MNDASVLYYSSPNPPDNFTWIVTGGSITSTDGNDLDTIYVTWGATGMVGNVRCVQINTCSNSPPTDYTVNVHSIQPSSISGPADVAENQTGEVYSITNQAGYTYSWTVTGGTITAGQGTNSITVDWGAAGSGDVQVDATYGSCSTVSKNLAVTIYVTIKSVQDGNWNTNATWDCNCVPTPSTHVRIQGGDTVILQADREVINFIIDPNGALDQNGNDFVVTGNYTNNGNQYGVGKLDLNGINTTISGIGNIKNTDDLRIDNGGKTILATANLAKYNGKIDIKGSFTITNKGTFSVIEDDLDGNNGSVWLNDVNSTLNVGGAINPDLSVSATGNTVNYNGSANQNVEVPVSSYYHLTLSGGGTKSMQGTIDVNGNLTISSILDIVNNARDIYLAGNWTNTGTFTERSGEVFFDGSGTQSITNTLGETFYDLTINKSAGTLILNNNVIASNILKMTAGNINTGTNTLTLGTGTGNVGTLTYTSGCIIGKFERWKAASTGNILYPVGTANYCRSANVNFPVNPTGGSLIGEFITTDPGSSGLPLSEAGLTPDSIRNTFTEGYWGFTDANGFVSTNYDLDLEGEAFTSLNINSSTRILKRLSSAASWTLDGTHSIATGDTTHRTGLNGFPGEFCFGDTTNCTGPTTGVITGRDSVCTAETGVKYSVPFDAAVTQYDWTITGGSVFGPEDNDTITVIWGGTGMVGTVQVQERNSCKLGAAVSKSVDIHTLPTSAITGKTSVAENTTGEAYSVTANTGYTYTWTIIGGTQVSGGTTNNITVNWGAAGSGTVRVTASSSCGLSDPVEISVTKYAVIKSIATGDWDVAGTWDCSCIPGDNENVIIDSADVVTLTADEIINNLTIYATGELANSNNRITVNGNYVNDGTHSGTDFIRLDGGGTLIDGSGTITNTADLQIRNGNKTIQATASLTKSAGDIDINENNITVTNNGTITVIGNLTGNNSSRIWSNAANSTLNVGTGLFDGQAGILNAFAVGNTVNYNGTGAQNIKTPSNSIYHHLTLSNSDTKTMGAALDINGNLTISETAQLASSNNNISLAGHWDNISTNGDPFIEGTSTVTFDGTATQNINPSGSNDETFYGLIMNKSGGDMTLTANTDVTITNELILTDGHVNTTVASILVLSSTAIITLNAPITQDSSFIRGSMKHTVDVATAVTKVFPIGKDIIYRRVDLTIDQSATTTTEYTAELIDNSAKDLGYTLPGTIDKASSIRYWKIDQQATGVGVDSAQVRLYYGNDDDVSDAPNLAVLKDDGAGNWIDLSGTASGSPTGNILSGSFTSFSEFALGNKSGGGNTLPIELLSFEANLIDGITYLNWMTATETNNDFFTIERSQDGNRFEEIIIINGAGNSNEKLYYKATDSTPLPGMSYYRLKQTDFDGKFMYADIVSVEFPDPLLKQPRFSKENPWFKVYPNPANGEVLVNVESMTGYLPSEEIFLSVIDLNGVEYYSKLVITDDKGDFFTAIDPYNRIPAGAYIVIGSANDDYYSQILIVQ